jgi:hypothetical protein
MPRKEVRRESKLEKHAPTLKETLELMEQNEREGLVNVFELPAGATINRLRSQVGALIMRMQDYAKHHTEDINGLAMLIDKLIHKVDDLDTYYDVECKNMQITINSIDESLKSAEQCILLLQQIIEPKRKSDDYEIGNVPKSPFGEDEYVERTPDNDEIDDSEENARWESI